MPANTLPGPLRLARSTPFVGRAPELARLRALVPRATGENRRIALVGGEAGSGKSRLVREFAHEVAADGVHVLYGACDAVVHTPYRPFADALEQLVRGTDPAILREDLGVAGGELTRMLPDLGAHVSGLPDPVIADPDTERHRLHTAVADVLAAAARRAPVLLVIEDAHWADAPTFDLLRHLARATTDARILVLATFRDTEADVSPELADVLADLRRSEDVVRLHLDGLTADDVDEFVRRAVGSEIDHSGRELTQTLHDLTEGNPFLLCELWRTLLETGAVVVEDGALRVTAPLREIATPESVREVVSQRLARLDPTTGALLELAAVAGPEFELGVLRLAAPEDLEHLDALEPAMRSGLIEELPSPTLAYRFTHELVRRALYDRLSVVRRAELHLRIGEALEATGRPARGRMLADLAHHFAAAAPIDGPRRAIDYNLLAADAASAALAHGEAAARLRTALRIGVEDAHRHTEILLALGSALYRAGRTDEALEAFLQAAEIARSLSDGELLARAAIGFEKTCWRPGLPDLGARELLDEASAAFQPEDSTLRVGLLAGLARALEFQGESQTALEVRERAVEMARRIDDGRGLAGVLMGSYWARSTTDLDTILQQLDEARELGERLGDIEVQAEAMEWRIAALMALGEIPAARGELELAQRMANDTRQPFILHVAEHYRSALALLEGRLADAEDAATRSREWGQLLLGRDASGIYGVQMFGVRREQGRLAELAPVVRVLASSERDGGAWRPGLTAMLAELDMTDAARRELDRVRRDGLSLLREALWLGSLTYLSDAASAVGHRPVAELVYPALEPLAGTNVMIGHGVACYGSTDRYLGMLAATLGESDLATRHFESALELDRAMGARTWLAHTAYEFGRLLTAQGDADRGGALLAEAGSLAESIGMPALLTRIRALGPVGEPALPDGLSSREVDVLRLIAAGCSNREIGSSLFISEHTAANHVRSILRKTDCANRTEAAAYAFRQRLVER